MNTSLQNCQESIEGETSKWHTHVEGDKSRFRPDCFNSVINEGSGSDAGSTGRGVNRSGVLTSDLTCRENCKCIQKPIEHFDHRNEFDMLTWKFEPPNSSRETSVQELDSFSGHYGVAEVSRHSNDKSTKPEDIREVSNKNAACYPEFMSPSFDQMLNCNQFLLQLGIAAEMNGESSPPPSIAGSGRNATQVPAQHGDSLAAGARKQLPAVPAPGSAVVDKDTSPRNSNYGPFFMEYSLLSEYNQIQKQKLPGVYVIPSAHSPLLWFGVLFIRQGLYQEGAFRFTLYIPESYPDCECPKLVFEPAVFHPVIHPETGELDVKRGFQKWRRNVNHLWQVLLYARRVFYKIDTKNPLNPEAAVLYEKNLELYKSKIHESIKHCKVQLYSPPKHDDPHAIRFSEWDPDVHESAKASMLDPKNPHDDSLKLAQVSGLSWMKKGSNQIFSKDDCPSL